MSDGSARKLIVGVGGGIAAFKVADLVSKLVQRGDDVWVVAAHSSLKFVGTATWAALCSRQPVVDAFDARFPLGPHIELPAHADALVIAPATARILASLAHGLADDLLATLFLHCECPTWVAPAMSSAMWSKPSTQRNLVQLKEDGIRTIGPNSGWLSCRRHGQGRMAEPAEILAALDVDAG